MNFKIFKRLIALPLTTTEMAVVSGLVFHVQKDGNSCFPSYLTIEKETGAVNKTISKTIRVLKYARILDFKHRGDPVTGKRSNEYFFIFEGIKFYRDGISNAQFKELDFKLKEIRTKVVTEMAIEFVEKKAKKALLKQSQMLRNKNSQYVNNDVCNVAGLKGVTIPSQMLRRSIRENVQSADNNTNDTNKTPCNEKGQKTVRHEKESNPFETINQDSNINKLVKQKDPSKQTIKEWLADFEEAEQRFK